MDITQERIEELEQQYQLTQNENWLVLKMDLEEQDFKSKCKELLKIYEKQQESTLCRAVYMSKLDNEQSYLELIKSLFNYRDTFRLPKGWRYGANLLFNSDNSTFKQHREIRISYLNFLIDNL